MTFKPNLQTTLDSGMILEYHPELDGGGLDTKDDFLHLIKQHGKAKYNRAFEWCAGFGVIGFEILGQGLTDELYFSDCYSLAIETCLENAKRNSIDHKVFGFVSSTIASLPQIPLWDLVVSNPPHVFDREPFVKGLMEYGNHSDISEIDDLDTALRLTLDQDFKIHTEFFNNIRNRITDDADIFISEVESFELFIELAESNGLRFCGSYSAYVNNNSSAKILHFKSK